MTTTDNEYGYVHSRFEAFRFLWLIFILFHMIISSPGWTTIGTGFLNPSNFFFLAINFLVVVFCIAALMRPANLYYFLASIICLTVVKLDALPSIPNHIILALIIHFTLLLSFALHRDRTLHLRERVVQWFGKAMPYMRVELLIMYFFVVLHKLNYDYFDPAVSCSVELYTDIAAFLPFLPQGTGLDMVIIVWILLVELTIPVLLVIPATRFLGVLVGLVFHFMLSLHPNLYILSFTAELYALYALFLPGEMIVRIRNTVVKKIDEIGIKRISTVAAGTGLAVVAVYFAGSMLYAGSLTAWRAEYDLAGHFFNLIQINWVIWCLVLMGVVLSISHGEWFNLIWKPAAPFFRLSWSPLLILPLLTFFNGITPYIGLKTATNFSMFSNLKVSGAETNHLFIPSSYQVSEKQNDTVHLLSTNSSYLQGFIDRNEHMTYLELSRYLMENNSEDIQVTFLRNGTRHTIRIPPGNSQAWLESSWLARKLLIFRGVPRSGPTPCQW